MALSQCLWPFQPCLSSADRKWTPQTEIEHLCRILPVWWNVFILRASVQAAFLNVFYYGGFVSEINLDDDNDYDDTSVRLNYLLSRAAPGSVTWLLDLHGRWTIGPILWFWLSWSVTMECRLFGVCGVEHVPYSSVRDITASQCNGCWPGVWSWSSQHWACQSLGPTRRLSHTEHWLIVSHLFTRFTSSSAQYFTAQNFLSTQTKGHEYQLLTL